jgi:PAS domain S-box-containing protein
VFLLLTALMPSWGLAGYAAWRWAQTERAALLAEALETARSLAIQVERELAGLRAGVAASAAVLARSGDTSLLGPLAGSFAPAGGQLSLIEDAAPPAEPADHDPRRALVRDALLLPAGTPALLSGFLPDPSGNHPMVGIAQRLPGNGPARVLLLTADAADRWSSILRQSRQHGDWVLAIIDSSGRIVAQDPDVPRPVGRSAPPILEALRNSLRNGRTEGETRSTMQDGRSAYVMWRHLSGDPWTAVVGVPDGAVEAPLLHALPLIGALGLVLMAGFTLMIGWWAERRLIAPLAALERRAFALAQGLNAPADSGGFRSGLREIDHAGEALSDAAAEREQQERRLRDLSVTLAGVLDHIPVGVVVAAAPSGRIVLCSRRVTEILGAPLPFSSGLNAYAEDWPLVDGAGHAMRLEEHPLAIVLRTGEPAQALCRSAVSGRWLRISAAPVRDAKGHVTSAVAAIADTDQERRAEMELRASELRFRALAEATPQIVLSALPNGTIEYVNPRFAALTGLDPSCVAAPGAPALHPADRDQVLLAWRRALRRRAPATAEFRLRRAGGGWLWVTASVLPAAGPDGAVQRFIAAASDVTDLIEAREALARQVTAEAAARRAALEAAVALTATEERFRRFAEASPDVMWIAAEDHRKLEYVSPAARGVWGIPPSRMTAGTDGWEGTLHPEDRESTLRAFHDGVKDGAPFTWEYRILRPDGSARWIRDTSFTLRGRPGESARIAGIARDITLSKASEARDAMLLGELNHRVKNTLATVQSLMVQTARTAAFAQDPMARFTVDFQGRILALSRAHELLTASTWEGATLQQAVTLSLAPWSGTPPESREGTRRVAWDGPEVWLRPRQALGLSMALHELATNATKHGALSSPRGQVEITWQLKPMADGTAHVRLDWRESDGPPVTPPSRKGFGSRLLERGLTTELGAGSSIALDYWPAGFHAEICFTTPGRPN